MASIDGTLKGSKLGLAVGFGSITVVCGAAYLWSNRTVASIDNAPTAPKLASKELIAVLESTAKQISTENVSIKDVINNEKIDVKKTHLAKCAVVSLQKFASKVEAEALKEAGVTEKDAKYALEYYLHPAVADASVQQAVTSVKVACAPTMYGEKQSLDILADSLSEDAVNSVAPKLLQMGAAAMQRMGNPQMVGQQLTQVAQGMWNQRLVELYGCSLQGIIGHIKTITGSRATALLQPQMEKMDKTLNGVLNAVMQQLMGGMGGGMRMG